MGKDFQTRRATLDFDTLSIPLGRMDGHTTDSAGPHHPQTYLKISLKLYNLAYCPKKSEMKPFGGLFWEQRPKSFAGKTPVQQGAARPEPRGPAQAVGRVGQARSALLVHCGPAERQQRPP